MSLEPGITTMDIQDLRERLIDFFKNYRDPETKRYKYRERIREMIIEGRRSLIIDFSDLISYDDRIAEMVIENPENIISIFSEAIAEVVTLENPRYIERIKKFIPRFRALPTVTELRALKSSHIGKLVMIDGIVIKATPPKQRISKAKFIHLDPECSQEFEVEIQSDVVEKPVYCPLCGKGGQFRLIPSKSTYIDYQKIVVQEKPEEVPSGQLPRSIEIVLEEELVDIARPGDRVSVVGIVKLTNTFRGRRSSKAIYDLYIEANNIEVSQRYLEEVEITPEDEEKIRQLARDPLIRRKIISSIAPSIYGYWDVKEAIALLLFGGVPKIASDGMKIRGDIHVLLIGDPGTAKSQILQYVAGVAPRAIYTTGKGSTAAGLTAAVTRDKATGEYYLEAGALVIADGGVACIDEIDKMRNEDRTVIHEAMEQQTISIAKAGIVARLNARTSILAAGNPKYGRYISTRSITDNVNLPVTILSRFDLIFILRDIPSTERDKSLAEHITSVHKDFEFIKPEIDPDLLRKYIAYARKYIKPKLTEEAKKMLTNFFVEMRKKSLEKPDAPITITARQLEALIRLAEAHAKMALKNFVTEEDAAEAIRLMKSMLESVGIDVESGVVDIDVIMTGKPKTQREKMTIIEDIIKELEAEEGCARIKKIVMKAKEKGIDESFVEKVITQLRREGILYEPSPGCVATVK